MNKVVQVEIIAFAPGTLDQCIYCHSSWEEGEASQAVTLKQYLTSLPGDHVREYEEISVWAARLLLDYGSQVVLRLVDAASMEGVAKSLQYNINYYPAVIVDHRAAFPEWELERATAEIEKILETQSAPCLEPC
jgi:hypothetical protein